MSMSYMQFLLGKIAEEAVELAQRCHKAQLFGLTEIEPDQPHNNLRRINMEYNDLVGVIGMLNEELSKLELNPVLPNNLLMTKKKIKVEKYLEYSRSLGMVAPPVFKGDWEM